MVQLVFAVSGQFEVETAIHLLVSTRSMLWLDWICKMITRCLGSSQLYNLACLCNFGPNRSRNCDPLALVHLCHWDLRSDLSGLRVDHWRSRTWPDWWFILFLRSRGHPKLKSWSAFVYGVTSMRFLVFLSLDLPPLFVLALICKNIACHCLFYSIFLSSFYCPCVE